MGYSHQEDVLLFWEGEGDTIKTFLIIKATCDAGLLSRAQRHRGKPCSKPEKISLIHKTLQPLPIKKKKATPLQDQLLSVPSLGKKKRWLLFNKKPHDLSTVAALKHQSI